MFLKGGSSWTTYVRSVSIIACLISVTYISQTKTDRELEDEASLSYVGDEK